MSKRIGKYFFIGAAIAMVAAGILALDDEDPEWFLIIEIGILLALPGLPFYFYQSKLKPMFDGLFVGREEEELKLRIRSEDGKLDSNSQLLLEMMATQNRTLRQIMYGVITMVIVFVILPSFQSC